MVMIHFLRKEGKREGRKEEEAQGDEGHLNLTYRKPRPSVMQTPLAHLLSLTIFHQEAHSPTFLQNRQKAFTQLKDGEKSFSAIFLASRKCSSQSLAPLTETK